MKSKVWALTIAGLLSLQVVHAQETQAVDGSVLKSDTINVDGYMKDQNKITDRELEYIKGELNKQRGEIQLNKEKSKGYKDLQKTTEKLAEETEEYLEEKKESESVIDEYNTKIKCLLEEIKGPECDKYAKRDAVSTAQAAPVVAAKVEEKKDSSITDNLKLIPYYAVTNYDSNVLADVESQMNIGLRAESLIWNNRMSIGLGVSWVTLESMDFNSSIFNPYWGSLNTAFRNFSYRNLGFELYGKYFITQTTRFRPYVGAGISYNRNSLRYEDFFITQQQAGNSELNTNYIGGMLMVGSEINFTKKIGAILELGYSSALGSSFSNNGQINIPGNFDAGNLERLSNELTQSDAFTLSAGLVVNF